MPPPSSNDWVVDDSEDDDDLVIKETSFARPPQQPSTISEFPTLEQVIHAEKPSPITNFTFDKTLAPPITPAAAAQSKYVKNRPQPSTADFSNIEEDTPAIRKVPPKPKVLVPDSTFLPSAAERAKSRQRVEGPQAKKGQKKGKDSAVAQKKDTPTEIVIDLSNEDSSPLRAGPSKLVKPRPSKTVPPPIAIPYRLQSFQTPRVPPSDGPLPPSDPPIPSSMVTTATLPSPLFDRSKLGTSGNTPPSSPFDLRKKKRRKLVAHDEDSDSMDVDFPVAKSITVENMAKDKAIPKVKADKAKPRVKKGTKADGRPKSPSTKKAPANKKVSAKETQQEFKSKEFVDDSSDDDLALVPRSAKTISDPPSSAASAPSSAVPLAPPAASSSVRPSLDLTAPPSFFVDVPSMSMKDTPPAPSANDGKAQKSHASKAKKPSDVEKPTSKAKSKKALKQAGSRLGEGADATTSTTAVVEGPLAPSSRQQTSKEVEAASKLKKPTAVSSATCAGINEQLSNSSEKAHDEIEKENKRAIPPVAPSPAPPTPTVQATEPSSSKPPASSKARFPSQHAAVRKSSMSDLIRRVSAKTNSPLASPSTAHPSPLAKASRTALSRIAPLHVNRRTPPPALPRPPPPKKTKKMLDLEEKWELELADTVEGWSCMAQDERAALMRHKRDKELGYDD